MSRNGLRHAEGMSTHTPAEAVAAGIDHAAAAALTRASEMGQVRRLLEAHGQAAPEAASTQSGDAS